MHLKFVMHQAAEFGIHFFKGHQQCCTLLTKLFKDTERIKIEKEAQGFKLTISWSRVVWSASVLQPLRRH